MHGVTRRFGGVSKKPFDSFNLGLHVGDDIEAVWENRRRLAKHLRVGPELLTCAQQVHGTEISEVTEANVGPVLFRWTKLSLIVMPYLPAWKKYRYYSW